jgi:hypothetical protein
MKLPAYMTSLKLSTLPVDYDSGWNTLIPFRECTDEDNPRLAGALQLISVKAAFALGVACFEWVVARVEGQIDTSDALQRIEAAWAAAIDPRYANLPQPPRSRTSPPQEFVKPLHLATKMLSDAHAHYTGGGEGVRSSAQGLVMLVDHLAGRHPAFDPWLADSLRRCHEHRPASEGPVEEEEPVPRELFDPSFVWSEDAVQEALRGFVEALDPAANPYLRSADEMLAAGFEGQPYGGSP